MSRVLIVEDDLDIAALLRHTLQRADYAVDAVTSGSAVLPQVAADRPDVIVLDLMLPGMDGLHVCQALRRDPATAAIPILMLTARGDEEDRVRGLELGADDYVTKPFSLKEVVARVAALLRRVARTETAAVLRYGPLTVDAERHAVEFEGEPVRLTAKEFLLLQYLLQRPGRVLSRDRLLTDVWGYQYTGGTRTVDVHVRRLREKIPALAPFIVTVKSVGYRLSADPEG